MSAAPSLIGATLLVVEDDPHVRRLVTDALQAIGLNVDTTLTRAGIFAVLRDNGCSAVVLDLGLPGDDGVDITRAIRERYSIPILILTGRSGVRSRVQGLEAGADDYLVKPFAPEELQARVRALLRRGAAAAPSDAQDIRRRPRALRIGQVTVDCASGALSGPGTRDTLTARELRLLLALSAVRGTLSREATYREVFGRTWDPEDRSLDVHIANLRRKLSRVGDGTPAISTVRGVGYEIRLPVAFLDEP
ncbi:MAG: response regulator transcription factor [Pseudomonadota bacterium]|jgi:two-component system OmpR family response regulator